MKQSDKVEIKLLIAKALIVVIVMAFLFLMGALVQKVLENYNLLSFI